MICKIALNLSFFFFVFANSLFVNSNDSNNKVFPNFMFFEILFFRHTMLIVNHL
jgi:hypothetical protein